jgi:3-hydroxyisobutyrate dehydrogenase-like beta-hydroxyacid dehydrogenase
MAYSRIGFVGFGEAAVNLMQGLIQEKACQIYAYDTDYIGAMQKKQKIDNRRITIVKGITELLSKCTIIFVAVPGTVDEEVFSELLRYKVKGILFVDICTSKPEIKNQIATKVDDCGGMYVDVAVMGSVPKLKHKVPMKVSGSGAIIFQKEFSEAGMQIDVVGQKAGEASVIKLCRSIYMKGIAALLIETKNVSKAYGVEEQVFSSIADSMDADLFEVYSKRLIDGTYKHCKRRKAEVEESLEIVHSAGFDGFMTDGTIKTYNYLLKEIEDENEI